MSTTTRKPRTPAQIEATRRLNIRRALPKVISTDKGLRPVAIFDSLVTLGVIADTEESRYHKGGQMADLLVLIPTVEKRGNVWFLAA